MRSWLAGVCGVAVVAAPVLMARTDGPSQNPAPLQTPATGTGFILGQVIDGSSGQPVPTAVVTLTRAGGGRGQANAAAAAAASMVGAPDLQRELVDATGRFVFHDLAKGSFSIGVSAPGYLEGTAGQAVPNGSARTVDLGDGERVGDLSIRLWKYGVLAGSVRDEAGDPAVGVIVRALRRTMSGASAKLSSVGQATTDDRGEYRIASLAPGDYLVAAPQTQITMPVAYLTQFMQSLASGGGNALMDVMASDGPPPNPMGLQIGDYLLESAAADRGAPLPPTADGRLLEYQTIFFPASLSPGQATVIALGSGEEHAGVNLQLRPVPTVRVSGLATGPDGPVPNVGVHLLPASWDASRGNGLEVATTAAGADGSFLFLGVPPGQYIVKIQKPPRAQLPAGLASNAFMSAAFGSGAAAAPTGIAAMALYAQMPLSVGTTDVTGVALTLNEGVKLSGRVQFVGSSGPPTGQRLQAMNVTVLGLDGQPPDLGSPFATLAAASGGARGNVGADGQFKTTGFPPGRYFVTANGAPAAGSAQGGGWMIQSAVVNGHDALTEAIDISSDLDGFVVTFTDKLTSVSGTVRTAGAGSSIEATVLAFPADYRTWIASGMSPRRTRQATVSKTGTYTLNNLLPGDYMVAAVDASDLDRTRDEAFFAALTPIGTRLSLGDGEKRTLDLPIVRIK